MKKLLLLSFIFYSSLSAIAQSYNQCGIIIPSVSLRSDFSSVYEAGSYIDNMLGKINWQENFQIREQNGINNAYATIIRNQRYIVYDNHFLERIDQYAGTKWASISVLAHEMGHHYHNHVVDGGGSSLPKELEADYFSGYVMAKMGANVEEAKAAMAQIASPMSSSSHPGKEDRLNAIANGWNKAKGVASQSPVKIPSPSPQSQQPSRPVNDAEWIHLSFYGNDNMNVFLSDDGGQFTQTSLKTNAPFVFRYEVYNYGWLRFGNNRNAKTYKLYHGNDYAIIWNRRINNWTVLEVTP